MAQPESTTPAKNSFSPDWFVRGILTKLGETFDRFTGRNWKPSSSLATSQLIERLKTLLDAEAKDLGDQVKVVPHHIKLKIQWDKFSADAEGSLKKLEIELLTAAIDHINDRRYHTYAPMQFEVKPDYFTEGVKLSASFDKFADEKEGEPDEVNVTIPDLKNIVIPSSESEIVEPEKEVFIASFNIKNQTKQITLAFSPKERKSVGRTKENDLWLDETSVSKLHVALVLNEDGQLMVADTGSTNGTFVGGVRIAYGKAIPLIDSDKLRFGTVNVGLRRVLKEIVEDNSAVQIPAGEDIRSENGDAAKEVSATNEIAANERILQEIVSPVTTVEIIENKDNFAKDKTSSLDKKEVAVNFDEKAPVKITKDEL